MKNNTIHLGKIMGIPIGLDPSWFLVFALITWILAAQYFPSEFKNWSTMQYWVVAAITSVLFFFSVLLHELGHSIIALRNKLQVRSINLYIFGGVSEITSEPSNARGEFVISLAGPLTSLLLAGIFYLLSLVFARVSPWLAMTKYLAYINGVLAIFNLIPGFPLDGGRVFRSIVWGLTHNLRRATEIAALLGHAIAFTFILLGVWQLFQRNWVNGLWIAFIGWFLENAVVGQVQQQRIHGLLSGHTVDQIMTTNCAMASPDTTLRELIEQFILDKGHRCLMIMQGDQAAGLLTLHDIRQVPRERWDHTRADEIMVPMEKVKMLEPKMGLEQALDEMGADGVNQMPVMDDGQIAGMLRREDIVNYMKLLQNLDKR